MKRRTTFFLKLALFVILIPVLALLIFILPKVMSELSEVIPVSAYLRYPGITALYAAVIPFIFALYQTIKLFININKDKAFSQISIKALKNIKYSAIIISILYVIGMPLLYLMADKDDAPGILLFALIVFSASVVTAFFCAVFEKECGRKESAYEN